MFKQILVAVDGSATSIRGLKVALAMAKDHDATLHVMHVIGGMGSAQSLPGLAKKYVSREFVEQMRSGLRDTGRKILTDAEKTAKKSGQSIRPILVETRDHAVADAILTEARKLDAELIVLGTHGRRGLTRLLVGSDAETVLREANVPVLLVGSPAHVIASQPAQKQPDPINA
jgi:nucleotide-binding universal stress UspA family protein